MRLWILLIAALLPSMYLLSQSLDVPMMGAFGDDTVYYSSAQSLAEGSGYRLPSLEGRPYQTKYPPLFPLMLSVAWRLNPNYPANLPVAAFIAWAAVPLYLFLSWRLFSSLGLSRGVGLGLVFVLALNGQVLLFGSMLMSEMWFACAILGTMLLAFEASNAADDWRLALAAGVAASVAYLVKSSALPLIAALPAGFLLRKQFRQAWQSTLPLLVTVAGWNIWARMHLTPSTDISVLYNTSYLGYYLHDLTWQTFVKMSAINFRLLYSGIPRMLILDPSTSTFENILTMFILVSGAIGVVRLSIRSRFPHYLLFAIIYVVQLVTWNFQPTPRLLLPVLPLFLAGIAAWVVDAFEVLKSDRPILQPRSIVSLVTAACCGPLILFLAVVSFGVLFRNMPAAIRENRISTEGKRAAYDWIVKNTPAQAGILANDDQLLYLYTGRRSASQIIPALLYYRDSEQALRDELHKLPEYARERRLDYVLVTSTDLRRESLEKFRPELDQILESAPGYRKVFDSKLARIYEAPGAMTAGNGR